MIRRFVFSIVTVALLLSGSVSQTAYSQKYATGYKVAAPAVTLTLPMKAGSTRFAVVGDTGTGSKQQRDIADTMVRYRTAFPFEFVLMLGDNMYGGESAKDFEMKFSDPYKQLLAQNVKFYAALGNHDLALQTNYVNFNMNGKSTTGSRRATWRSTRSTATTWTRNRCSGCRTS